MCHKSIQQTVPGHVFCASTTSKREYIWKHVRTQHLNLYVHICQFKNCNKAKNGLKFGNDELTTVWAHMEMKHGLKNQLGCPLCKRVFSGKAAQMLNINSCEVLKPPRRTKTLFAPGPNVAKDMLMKPHLPIILLTMMAK